MTNGKVILVMALIVAGSLVAATVVGAFAGGIAGYLVARWEGRGPCPTPLPEERGEIPFPEPLPLPRLKSQEPVEGALVTKVEPESPAEEAGIKMGDIITAVDGLEIDEDHPLRDLILDHEPGEKITLTLSRGGESREIRVTLGETTDEEGKTIPYLGIHYWSIKRRFFQPQGLDWGRLPQPRLNLLFRRLLRRIRPRLPNV
ncbi:MAG: S1C family serine protease [Anaerolineae bacterium]